MELHLSISILRQQARDHMDKVLVPSFSLVFFLGLKSSFSLPVLICAAFLINSKAEGSGSGCSWEHKWGSSAGGGNGVL